MIITLRYKLPEEEQEFNAALSGQRSLAALSDIDELLRSIYKYGREGYDSATIDNIRDDFYEIMGRREVDL